MTAQERMEAYFYAHDTTIPICANCVYYREHYNKDGCHLNMGHCTFPRLKPRRVYDTCANFKNKEGNG